MIHTKTILDENKRKFFRIFPVEKPIVFQVGGSNADDLAKSCQIIEELGYDQINLNCGCPSQQVQCGQFGACLMKDPKNVGNLLKKMKESTQLPITVKCRIGVDEFDSYEFFKDFIETVHKESGVDTFIVHARKCLLQGLSPDQNRNVPQLKNYQN